VAVTESAETDQAVVNAVRDFKLASLELDRASKEVGDKRQALSAVFPRDRCKHDVVVDGEIFEVIRFDGASPPSVAFKGKAIQDQAVVSPPLPASPVEGESQTSGE
jgi:hypothetical protein